MFLTTARGEESKPRRTQAKPRKSYDAGSTLHVILNNATGAENQGSLRDRLIEIFKQHNINPEIHLAKRGDGITTIAEAAARNGCFAMAAGRGNWTVNAVASALIDSERCAY
jgi:diacylglycerol kinase family enzyme